MDNHFGAFNNSGQKDYLMIPAIDLSNNAVSGTVLEFNVAYARFNNSTNDRLEVRVSTDCGVTWTTLYNRLGINLATVPNAITAFFTPTATQWRKEVINIDNYLSMSDVRFMFVFTSNSGNNVYIDDITIHNTTGIADNTDNTMNISVYPNPGSGQFTLETPNINTPVVVNVLNILGESVLTFTESSHNGKIKFDLSGQPSGTYLLQIKQGEMVSVQRLQVIE
jgi:Secretion system C-terminal sorting domain